MESGEGMTDAEFLTHLQAAVDLRRKGEYQASWSEAMICIIERPEESSGWHATGQIQTELGNFDLKAHQQAMRLFRSKCNPADRPEQFQPLALGLAHALMRYGRFEEAWPYWEAGRLDASWQPWTGSQYWDGSDPVPESLLVQAEGGYGDLFMFSTFLPKLKERGVKKIGLMLWPAAEKVFRWPMFGVDRGSIYLIGRDQIPFTWTHSTSIMSLGAVVKVKEWRDIPTWPAWQGTTATRPVRRIGFAWRAEESTSPLRLKSLPWEVAGAVARLLFRDRDESGSDFDLFSLSPEKADLYSKAEFSQPPRVTYEPERMTDWAATRDYILSMDFVVTVDTAVAHLTGLLGVPCLVLLPIGACWRWGMPGILPYRQGTYWYGPQLTIYRQKQPLVWDADEIVAAVKERIG